MSDSGGGDRRRSGWKAEWLAIGLGAGIAVVLGCIGFAQMYAAIGEERDFWDSLYGSLQLFVLESGSVTGPVYWPLQVARFLAPAVTLITAATAIAFVIGEQLGQVHLRLVKDHTVICGLGRRGLLVTKELTRRGESVVVVDNDEGNELIESARERGAAIVIGDAGSIDVLRRAAVPRARRVLAVCGDDGANAAVAVHCRTLALGRTARPLDCVVHIVDDRLCRLLREQELRGEPVPRVRCEFFNAYERGARLLLRDYAPFDAARPVTDGAPHVVVVGCGCMGGRLVAEAAREWWHAARGSEERLLVTVVDREARARCAALELRWPRLSESCELSPVELDVTSPEFDRGEFLNGDTAHQSPATRIYVCFDDDSRSLTAALALHASVPGRRLPIVVRMSSMSGLASLATDARGGFENLACFSLTDLTCAPDRLFAGTHEMLARGIHEAYLAEQAAHGVSDRDNPSLVTWERLPEDLRDSNLRQADHIVAKLAAVGYDIAPLADWDAEDFAFAPEEVEAMGAVEHARWLDEHWATGWAFDAGPKDPSRKTSPFLVAWDELPAQQRADECAAVRDLPRLLASVGLQVVRIPSTGETERRSGVETLKGRGAAPSRRAPPPKAQVT